MNTVLSTVSLTGRIGVGNYTLEIVQIERGYRLVMTRGGEVQTIDILNGVGIERIEKVGETDNSNTYRMIFTDGQTFDYNIEPGEEAREAAEAERIKAENERATIFSGYEERIAAVERQNIDIRLGGLSFAVNAEDGGLDIIYNN